MAAAPAPSGTHCSGHLTVPEAWAEQDSLSSQHRHKGARGAASPRPRPHAGRTRRDAPAWVGGGPPLLRTMTSAPSTHGAAQVPPRTSLCSGTGGGGKRGAGPLPSPPAGPGAQRGSYETTRERARCGGTGARWGGPPPAPPSRGPLRPSGCPGDVRKQCVGLPLGAQN